MLIIDSFAALIRMVRDWIGSSGGGGKNTCRAALRLARSSADMSAVGASGVDERDERRDITDITLTVNLTFCRPDDQ